MFLFCSHARVNLGLAPATGSGRQQESVVMSKTRPQRETVKHLTYFVVQTFSAVKGDGLAAADTIPARDRGHSLQLLDRYKPIRAGVVAFHRTGDPKTGDWDDAVVIARHGRLPSDIDDLVAEDEIDADCWDLRAPDLNVA
jgi:hypothetical protein